MVTVRRDRELGLKRTWGIDEGYTTNVFRECASDGVTRKTRSNVIAQSRTSGQLMKHFSKIEGILGERRGESKYYK